MPFLLCQSSAASRIEKGSGGANCRSHRVPPVMPQNQRHPCLHSCSPVPCHAAGLLHSWLDSVTGHSRLVMLASACAQVQATFAGMPRLVGEACQAAAQAAVAEALPKELAGPALQVSPFMGMQLLAMQSAFLCMLLQSYGKPISVSYLPAH